MKTWVKYLIIIVVIALASIVFYKKVYIPKTTFKTTNATKGSLEVTIGGIGNVGAKDIYNITAQTGGKVLSILSDEGKWVKKNDLLIVMDGVDLKAQLDGAKAGLKKAKYEVISSENELKNEQAQKELIQKTYDRYNKLNSQGYVTRAEYDKAKADLQSINANIKASISRIDSAKAAVAQAVKIVEAFEIKISKLKIYAPVDGYVISKNIEANQDVLPTTIILKIVDPKTLWVETNIDERVSSKIKLNQKATITLRSQPNHPFSGKVVRIEAQSDAVTLEKKIDVTFSVIPKPFYINEQARVDIRVKKYENVFKIPLNLVAQENGKLGVWIAKDHKVHFLKIKKIGQNDSEIAVSNIDENTKIIIPNTHKKTLSEGMKIRL